MLAIAIVTVLLALVGSVTISPQDKYTLQVPNGLASEVDIDLARVETNIVRFRSRGVPAGQFVEVAHGMGVHILPSGPDGSQ